jgi:PmbA protein
MEKIQRRLQDGLEAAGRLGARAAKIRFERSERIGCGFENGRLKTAESKRNESFGIDVLLDGRRGVAGGNDLGDLDEMIERAVALAAAGSAAHFDAYPPPGDVHPVRTAADSTRALSRDEMVHGCQSIVDALKEYDPDLFIWASANRSEKRKLLVTTGGVCHEIDATHWSLSSTVQRTDRTDILMTGCWRSWREKSDLYDPAYIAGEILQDLRNAETRAEPPTGPTTVLLHPFIFSMALHAVTLGVNGRNVAKGDSPLAGRLGEQVFDPAFSLTDNPHRDYDNGACPIDNDGVPTRVVPIVAEGVLSGFLYDLDSAGLAGAEPTGNNGCSPYSLEVSPGSASSDDLLAGIDDGLYVKYLMGFGQSNLINGDFSANVALGYRIRGGKLAGRVKNTMLAGNVYDLLKASVAFSSDIDPVLHVPYARLEGAAASAAGA